MNGPVHLEGNPRIALVHDWLTVPAGSEEVFREMAALFPGTVFTSQYDPDRIRFLANEEVRTSFVQRLPGSLRRHYLYAPLLPYVYRSFDLRNFDLVLSSSHSFAHGVRKAPHAVHLNYTHTPARALWSPEVDPRGSKTFLHRWLASHLRRLDLEASKRPDVFFANSRTTAERIRRFYGRDSQVIHPPVHVAKWQDVGRVDEDLGYLYWGRLIAYKRVDLLIRAARAKGFALQIVGSGPEEARLRRLAADVPSVEFHGRLPDEQLKALMARCRAFLFPAYEDFGIVVVEAMAAGLPVVAFGEGGASETVTNETGVLFSSQTLESLLGGVEEFESRTFDSRTLRAQAWKFDVDVFRGRYARAVSEAWKAHREGAT
ncbi:MAG TPA: glycosyltransferase [Fimbriimonadaceae bacterium]|nr:glycosyltransferase [Fimbriimonadaceae bacterium]